MKDLSLRGWARRPGAHAGEALDVMSALQPSTSGANRSRLAIRRANLDCVRTPEAMRRAGCAPMSAQIAARRLDEDRQRPDHHVAHIDEARKVRRSAASGRLG